MLIQLFSNGTKSHLLIKAIKEVILILSLHSGSLMNSGLLNINEVRYSGNKREGVLTEWYSRRRRVVAFG